MGLGSFENINIFFILGSADLFYNTTELIIKKKTITI